MLPPSRTQLGLFFVLLCPANIIGLWCSYPTQVSASHCLNRRDLWADREKQTKQVAEELAGGEKQKGSEAECQQPCNPE
ncbi:hypothetical protein JRQ81_001939 [Phrynocephalus forsythii]|uniref:Uncharacterized protein n=1 Tax=Phrynocephalus forsythii TaxID=171643 RepID=A0A9Q1BAB0_9SAUR|nr:hypothetical protein JRQ81_001939 [Phrynocephalus forsythii]